MRFVPLKEIWQQDLQSLHRARSLLIGHRIALSNALRGLLHERGHVFPQGDHALRNGWAELFSRSDAPMSGLLSDVLQALWNQMVSLGKQVEDLDLKIKKIALSDPRCKRLQKIEGVGPMTATAIVAAVGDAKAFKNGRQLSAFLGLVPKQCSSGGKQQLLGISKRGDGYLRKLLIHGARSAILVADKRDTRRNRWVIEKVKTRGMNKATVALANRNARVIWAILAKNEEYLAAA
jgi:transposase